MKEPPKTLYVAMYHDSDGSDYVNTFDSEWEAANMVDGDGSYGPVYIYERVSGPLKIEIKRDVIVTPIEPKRKRSKK
jgi:hypothetical protein